MRVVFFDIDGTILDSRHSGRAAFLKALHTAFGWTDDIDYIDFTGATDLDVISRVFANYGRVPTREDEELFFDVMPRELERTCRKTPPVLLPGVRCLLDTLAQRSDICVGLLTGNIEECAHIKLKYAGLDHRFDLGAFGHEHADRNEIARLALRRAELMHAHEGGIDKVFIIGDSPADVRAAQAIGAVAVAVATGTPTRQELAAAGADIVFDDLSCPEQVLRALDLQT